jgi:hypothetical protein
MLATRQQVIHEISGLANWFAGETIPLGVVLTEKLGTEFFHPFIDFFGKMIQKLLSLVSTGLHELVRNIPAWEKTDAKTPVIFFTFSLAIRTSH